jgi:phosphomannomutase/phosphoglucomutase
MFVPAPEIFKAYDIRGIVDKTLTAEAVRAIGHALGSEAVARGQKAIAVGRDGRLSGPELAGALSDGIRAAGVDVVDVGCVPTPLTYFAAYELGTNSCVSVTGSHNPPDYNGLKMVLGGQTLFGELIQALRQRIIDGNLVNAAVPGKLTQADVVPAYVDKIIGDVKLSRPMKIVMDCGNGVAGAVAPELFKRLGCELVELFCEVDGNFPNHHPDPSKPENLADVIRALKETDAEIGLAFDGDGDRLGVVTKDGEIIFPDRQLMLFAEDVLTRVPGGEIIYDVKCTRNLAGWIKARGGKPTMWNTGHALVKAKLKETGAPLAGEMSGHVFFKERWYGFDDGLYTGARLLEIVSRQRRRQSGPQGPARRHQHAGTEHQDERRRALRPGGQAQGRGELRRRRKHAHHRRCARRVRRRFWPCPPVQHHPGGGAALRSGYPGGHRAHPGRFPPRHRRRVAGHPAAFLTPWQQV